MHAIYGRYLFLLFFAKQISIAEYIIIIFPFDTLFVLILFYDIDQTEQQHVETNLRTTSAGISVVLSFFDEENNFYDHKIWNTAGLQIDYLAAECHEIDVALRVIFSFMRTPLHSH